MNTRYNSRNKVWYISGYSLACHLSAIITTFYEAHLDTIFLFWYIKSRKGALQFSLYETFGRILDKNFMAGFDIRRKITEESQVWKTNISDLMTSGHSLVETQRFIY